ncbi:hypothetical protein [Marinomonas flavescens]|uniref:hypothetical protein n=1 Tax=Marinomonas flavescens TaxID=2529379 RepID=UPI001055D1E6|nr:hypothetical protein [Marinomonas flavescens]
MRFLLLVIGILYITPVLALSPPTGRVLLTLTGSITETNAGHTAKLDRKMLNALPRYSITTKNPWVHQAHKYSGFSAVDLLKLTGGKGDLLRITALNKYVIEIPITDFTKRGAIFAMRKDSHPMSVRELGPILVMYPFDDDPKLKNETYYWRSIWQISTIEVLTSPSKE